VVFARAPIRVRLAVGAGGADGNERSAAVLTWWHRYILLRYYLCGEVSAQNGRLPTKMVGYGFLGGEPTIKPTKAKMRLMSVIFVVFTLTTIYI
jgi:hypothetical protein